MNNYQLYRTNILLGGQMKWDLVIDGTNRALCISDFQLSPISNVATYMHSTNEYLLKNSHQDNVKNYYKLNRKYFYDECLAPNFRNNWPSITKNNTVIDSYSNIYDMGCRRASIKKYDKQFEFLCPIWIEHLNGELSFKISLKTSDGNTTLSTKILRLSPIGSNYHDRFVSYFDNFMQDSKLKVGNDNIIKINLNNIGVNSKIADIRTHNNSSYINGLNVRNGIIGTSNISYAINRLLKTEMPLMQFDDIIIRLFEQNNMICNQLINFNFCFNIEDLLSGSLLNIPIGENVIVSIVAMINGEELKKVDFYTDYNYIERESNNNQFDNVSYNVLDYLNDNKSIELIKTNKYCQNICHWVLNDNSNYIFNLYEGFSGLIFNTNEHGETNKYENLHHYGLTPDLEINSNNGIFNITEWFNVVNINTWNAFYKYIKNTNKYRTDGSLINGDNRFINKIKYAYRPSFENPTYMLGMVVSRNLLDSILDFVKVNDDIEIINLHKNKLYMIVKDDLIMLITTNHNCLIFNTFNKIFDDIKITDDMTPNYVNVIGEISLLMHSKIDPKIIIFDRITNTMPCISPTFNCNISEITYKNVLNIDKKYVIRYDGNIKPLFTTQRNTIYFKDYINENTVNSSKYIKYSKSGFEPIYPSINYCTIMNIDPSNWDYATPPTVCVSAFPYPISIYKYNTEYKWFNNSLCSLLDKEFTYTYTNVTTGDGYLSKPIDDIVHDGFCSHYNNNNEAFINYIKTLYDYKVDWEYVSETNVDDYVYTVKYTLK